MSDDADAVRGIRRLLTEARMDLLLYRIERMARGETGERKDLTATFKALDEEGLFEGYASVYGLVDFAGDIVEPGAFRDAILSRETFPLTLEHDLTEPIGVVVIEDDPVRGLYVRGQLNLGTSRAREVFDRLRRGALRGLSFGFDAIEKVVHGGVRHLQRVKLHEIALTDRPAMPLAGVTAVKAHGRSRWEDGVRDGWAEYESRRPE